MYMLSESPFFQSNWFINAIGSCIEWRRSTIGDTTTWCMSDSWPVEFWKNLFIGTLRSPNTRLRAGGFITSVGFWGCIWYWYAALNITLWLVTGYGSLPTILIDLLAGIRSTFSVGLTCRRSRSKICIAGGRFFFCCFSIIKCFLWLVTDWGLIHHIFILSPSWLPGFGYGLVSLLPTSDASRGENWLLGSEDCKSCWSESSKVMWGSFCGIYLPWCFDALPHPALLGDFFMSIFFYRYKP